MSRNINTPPSDHRFLRSKDKQKKVWRVVVTLLIMLLIVASLALNFTNRSHARRVNVVLTKVFGNLEVYLPVGFNQGPFTPSTDTTLEGGTYGFSSIMIPEGITVTVTGNVTINVHGDTEIAGNLVADCYGVEIRGVGDFTVDGFVTNTCDTPPEDAPGIKVIADGLILIGTDISTDEALVSAGEVFISDSATEGISTDLIYDVEEDGLFSTIPSQDNLVIQGQGGGATVNRPIRAGKGKELRVTNAGNVLVNANLTAENGKDAQALVQPGTCDASNLIGGIGGRVSVYGDSQVSIGNGVTIKAGDGGKGGSCTAPSGCPAIAIGGMGGRGGSVGFGGGDIFFGANVTLIRGSGGPGGDAIATADDGANPCEDGCDATATGGMGGPMGGIGYLYVEPGSINGNPDEAGGNGGTGGTATATGGDGQDCDQCPGGDGGNGGMATATGGKGGNGAKGNIWNVVAGSHLKGNGGDATATRGKGGNGADCCGPDKFGPHQEGGNGGAGGDATATGGAIGDNGLGGNGLRGNTGGTGGNGGDGGDGTPPGTGGPGGTGTGDPVDIPDGNPGMAGEPCPVLTIWFIYHSSIPDGAIPPGAVITLTTYITPDIGTDPTGAVPLYFMTQEELEYPPNYSKLDNMLQVVGGLRYDLTPILEGFPVIGADVSLNHTCLNPGCIQILGFSGGDVVGMAPNQQIWGGGPPIHEQILLPPPPAGMLYDGFAIILMSPTSFYEFDHWWIIIIDP